MWPRKKKNPQKLKSLIRFHRANKIDNYKGRGAGQGRKKENPKEATEQVKT